MSAQCFCYDCGGKTVTRHTFRRHGRKDKPDPPAPPQLHVLPMVSMPEVAIEEVEDADPDAHEDQDLGRPGCIWKSLKRKREEMEEDDGLEESIRVGRAGLAPDEITLMILDWLSVHKGTDMSAQDIWQLVHMLLPEGADIPTWSHIKTVLKTCETRFVRRIEVCPNDCLAFWNSKHLPEPYRHAHRTVCLVCGEARHLVDPVDRSVKPAKVIYFFPLGPWVQSLYTNPNLVPHLYADREVETDGGIRNSRGWKQKMVDNPVMNQDHRNLGLVGTCDGVPFFKDQRRGGWMFVQRVANLPETLSQHMANCHLHMLSANEYWVIDESAGVLRRRIRAPKSLMPHMHVIADDLLGAYKHGLCI